MNIPQSGRQINPTQVHSEKTIQSKINQSNKSQLQPYRQKMCILEGPFISYRIFGCLGFEVYTILKNITLYIYENKRAFLNKPQAPIKFLNLNCLEFTLDKNWIVFQRKGQKYYQLSHFNHDKLTELFANLQHNKKNLSLYKLYQKKFLDIQNRIYQKLQQQQKL